MSRFDFLREEKDEYTKMRERNWDNRFYLEKIPPFDSFSKSEHRYLNLHLRNIKKGYYKDLKKQEEEKRIYGIRRAQYKNPEANKTYSNFYKTNRSQEYSRTQSNWNDNQSPSNTIRYKYKPSEKFQIDASQSQNEYNFTNSNDLKMSTQEFNKKKYKNTGKKNLYPEDDKFNEEKKKKIETLKKEWKDFGVTKKFQKTFEHMINTQISQIKDYENNDDIKGKENGERELLDLIDNERTELKKFKHGLLNLKKAINQREKEIENIKNLDNYYYLNKKEIEKIKKEKENEENENNNSNLEENDNKDLDNMDSLNYKQFLDEQIKKNK